MAEGSKFRSIGAFKSYSQRRVEPPSATELLSIIKRRGGSARIGDLAGELDTDVHQLTETVDDLINAGLVTVVVADHVEDNVLNL